MKSDPKIFTIPFTCRGTASLEAPSKRLAESYLRLGTRLSFDLPDDWEVYGPKPPPNLKEYVEEKKLPEYFYLMSVGEQAGPRIGPMDVYHGHACHAPLEDPDTEVWRRVMLILGAFKDPVVFEIEYLPGVDYNQVIKELVSGFREATSECRLSEFVDSIRDPRIRIRVVENVIYKVPPRAKRNKNTPPRAYRRAPASTKGLQL